MWSRLYRDHLIMPFPSYDTAANAWAPQANISWSIGPSRESEFVRFHNRFTTQADAVACALRRAEVWVDIRLGRLRNGLGPEDGRVRALIGVQRRSPGKTGAAKPLPVQESIQGQAETTFTFDQFKSALAKRGVKLSEPTLQKSYTALVKLRRDNHWSWAQMKQKVEHSQQNQERSLAQQQKTQRIPLTKRDWCRVI